MKKKSVRRVKASRPSFWIDYKVPQCMLQNKPLSLHEVASLLNTSDNIARRIAKSI